MNWTLIFPFFAMGIAILILACDFAAFYRSLSPIDHYTPSALITYIIVCAALIVPCGSISDKFGRKNLFLIGLTLFALLSAASATVQPGEWQVVARAFQGVAAALLWSSILGICYVSVPQEKKSFAMGLLLGSVGLALAAGLSFVHFIPEILSTHHIMWINVVLALIALVIAYFKLPPSPKSEEVHVDYWGTIALSLGVAPLVYALLTSPDQSFDSLKLWGLISLLFFVLFVLIERFVSHPLLPFLQGKKRQFIAAAFIIALLSAPFFTTLRYLPEYMQKLMDFTLYETSLGLTPMLLIWALVSPVAGDLYQHLGAKMIIFIASLAIAVGVFLLGFVGPQLNYFFLLPGLIISGLGYGFGFSSITTAAIGSVKEGKASLSGAFVYLFFIIGGALGIALASLILQAASEPHFGPFSPFFEKNIQEALPLDAFGKNYLRGYFWTMLSAAIPPSLGALVTLFFMKKE